MNGNRPAAASGKPSVASSAATARSHATITPKPPAWAGPFTAATSGLPRRVMASSITSSACIRSRAEPLRALGDIRKANEVVELFERSQLVGDRIRRAARAHEGLHHVLHGFVHREHWFDGAERVIESELVHFLQRKIR